MATDEKPSLFVTLLVGVAAAALGGLLADWFRKMRDARQIEAAED